MRMFLASLMALALLFPACKPEQEAGKPAQASSTEGTSKTDAMEGDAPATGLENESLGDFEVNTGASSASSRK